MCHRPSVLALSTSSRREPPRFFCAVPASPRRSAPKRSQPGFCPSARKSAISWAAGCALNAGFGASYGLRLRSSTSRRPAGRCGCRRSSRGRHAGASSGCVAGKGGGGMLAPSLFGVGLHVEAAAHEQHEQVEFVDSPVVRGDSGVCPAPEPEQELGGPTDNLADHLKVVQRGDPGQVTFSQQARSRSPSATASGPKSSRPMTIARTSRTAARSSQEPSPSHTP